MSRWPIPGTRPVDRAREVARTCWQALHRVDPDAAALIAQAAAAAGEHWLSAQIATHGPDDLVTVAEAAELAGRSVRWAYDWVAADRERRSTTAADGHLRVRVRDVLDAASSTARTGPA